MLLMRSFIYHIHRFGKNIHCKYERYNKHKNTQFIENLVHLGTENKSCLSGRRFLHTVATVQNRTSRLLELLGNARNDNSRLVRLEELNEHLLRYNFEENVVLNSDR